MSSLLIVLLNTLMYVFSELASENTKRFFVEQLDNGGVVEVNGIEYPKRVYDVVQTFIAILSKPYRTSRITANGETFQVSDYLFPSQWWKLASAKVIYFSEGAMEVGEPWFQVAGPSDGEMQTPRSILRFFSNFGSRQEQGDFTFSLSGPDGDFDQMATFFDLKAAVDANGSLVEVNPNGKVSDMVSQVLGICMPSGISSDCLKAYSGANSRRVMSWLLSEGQSTRS